MGGIHHVGSPSGRRDRRLVGAGDADRAGRAGAWTASAHAEQVIAAWPEQALEEIGGIDPVTSIVVRTRDPKLDDAALTLALHSPARFIGAMGSRQAQAVRRERLLAAGLAEEEIARISAPVGLDLGAIGTQETTLSIFAEVVAARHGREGSRLAPAWPNPPGAGLIEVGA